MKPVADTLNRLASRGVDINEALTLAESHPDLLRVNKKEDVHRRKFRGEPRKPRKVSRFVFPAGEWTAQELAEERGLSPARISQRIKEAGAQVRVARLEKGSGRGRPTAYYVYAPAVEQPAECENSAQLAECGNASDARPQAPGAF